MIDLLPIYRKARKLVTDPQHWVQYGYGKDMYDQYVNIDHLDEAVSYCAMGALIRAYRMSHQKSSYCNIEHLLSPINLTLSLTGYQEVAIWQDRKGRTHKEVLDLFDKTIRNLKKHPEIRRV